jgi:homocysteine S-methyltransferase
VQGFGLSLDVIKIDGGLSTALEDQGADLKSILWTGELIEKNPDAIIAAHKAFISSGAQIIITSSYQVSFIGKEKTGKSDQEISELLKTSTKLARTAAEGSSAKVAASVGPYGAALGDGSEYRGNYGISESSLKDFHQKRIKVLAETSPDLFAIETIPSLAEAKIIEEIVIQTDIPYWISFSCKDERNISEGDSFKEAISELSNSKNRIAVGINCTDPKFVTPLLNSVSVHGDFVVYPNAGSTWDADAKVWIGDQTGFNQYVSEWIALGAQFIGGCCGVGPKEISVI